MKTTVIGLGLIGGSIALDLRKAGLATELVGVDLNPANGSRAVERGLVDRIDNDGSALSSADSRDPCDSGKCIESATAVGVRYREEES